MPLTDENAADTVAKWIIGVRADIIKYQAAYGIKVILNTVTNLDFTKISPRELLNAFVEGNSSPDIKDYIYNRINTGVISFIQDNSGLMLDPAQPFSKRSLTLAISTKLGFPIEDITNRSAVLDAVGTLITAEINQKMGTHFDNLGVRDLDVLKEQFKIEFAMQLTAAMNGQSSLFDPVFTEQLVSIVVEAKALTSDPTKTPRTQAEDEALIAHRYAQRKYYKRQKLAGRARKYVQVIIPTPTPTPSPSP